MLEQELARPRQLEAALAAAALDQPLAEALLEQGDLLAGGRLREAEALRRRAERAGVRDGAEGDEVPEVERGPGIERHA